MKRRNEGGSLLTVLVLGCFRTLCFFPFTSLQTIKISDFVGCCKHLPVSISTTSLITSDITKSLSIIYHSAKVMSASSKDDLHTVLAAHHSSRAATQMSHSIVD